MKVCLWVLLLSAGVAARPAYAERNFYVGAALDWNSSYIWRGITVDESAVLQPSAWANLFDTNILIWANRPLHDPSGWIGFNEIDVFFQGTSPREKIVAVPGMNFYTYPRSVEVSWTAEVALTFYIPVGPVWISWENNLDIRAYPGAFYAEVGLQTGWEIAPHLSLEASLAQGLASTEFNQAYLGVKGEPLTHLTAHLGFEWELAGILSLTPHLEAVFVVGRELREIQGGAPRFNFGLTLTIGRD